MKMENYRLFSLFSGLYDLTLLRCKTCAIDIGSLNATYLLTYLLTCLLILTDFHFSPFTLCFCWPAVD